MQYIIKTRQPLRSFPAPSSQTDLEKIQLDVILNKVDALPLLPTVEVVLTDQKSQLAGSQRLLQSLLLGEKLIRFVT